MNTWTTIDPDERHKLLEAVANKHGSDSVETSTVVAKARVQAENGLGTYLYTVEQARELLRDD